MRQGFCYKEMFLKYEVHGSSVLSMLCAYYRSQTKLNFL